MAEKYTKKYAELCARAIKTVEDLGFILIGTSTKHADVEIFRKGDRFIVIHFTFPEPLIAKLDSWLTIDGAQVYLRDFAYHPD